MVELTIAIHKVFDTPNDRLIFDVGHQCYPHKILTGRRDRIRTLRTGGGLSGFTKRSESEYDPFGAAHSSTSISAGLGMAVARDLKGDDNRIDQWAAYRYPDGTVVYVAQSRSAVNGDSNLQPLTTLPLTVPQLAALAVNPKFHLS